MRHCGLRKERWLRASVISISSSLQPRCCSERCRVHSTDERHAQKGLTRNRLSDSAVGPSGHSFGSTSCEASDSLYIYIYESSRAFIQCAVISISAIIVQIVMCHDAGNDRFHVTVSFAAGREASGRRRLARDDVEYFCRIHFPRAGWLSPSRRITWVRLGPICAPRLNGAASLLAPPSTRRSAVC